MTPLAKRLIDPLVGREGGYVNHPSDRGGPTIWGVTEEVARRYGYAGPMVAMPRSEAERIYEERYLIAPGIAGVVEVNFLIGEELFDTGVNMGVAWPGLFLQRALNAFNRRAADYPDLQIDGDIGPATLKALRRFLTVRGLTGVDVLLKALNAQQGVRYLDITEARDLNEDFTFGWFRTRVGALA